jgi:hypothetical protein
MREVNAFVSQVYSSLATWVALCLIPPHAQHPEHRFLTLDRLSRFLAYARYRNAQGWGIHITPSQLKPNPRNRRQESFEDQQTVIYLDCDQPPCLEQIRQRYPYPRLVVRTSQGRHQVYWRLDQAVNIAQQQELMSAMAVDVGADRAATDVSRVLRLPGFWNRKPGRNNTVDIVFTRDQSVRYEALLDRVAPSRTGQRRPPNIPRHDSSTAEEVGGSGRLACLEAFSASERDWYQVHRRLDHGDQPQEIITWLQAKRSDKPNPRYYAELTVSKAVASRNGGPS